MDQVEFGEVSEFILSPTNLFVHLTRITSFHFRPRYHALAEGDSKSKFLPGKISDDLRSALGLRSLFMFFLLKDVLSLSVDGLKFFDLYFRPRRDSRMDL